MKTIIITIVSWEALKWAYRYFLKDTVDQKIREFNATSGHPDPKKEEK